MRHIALIITTLLLAGTLMAMQQPQFTENATISVATAIDTSGDDYDCCAVSTTAAETEGLSAEAAAIIRERKASIVGQWENTVYPFEVDDAGIVPGAFLRYHFAKDGSYTKVVGNTNMAIKETGIWYIAVDGNHVIMEAEDGAYSEAAIKLLQLDEMVLQHELKVNNPAFCTQEKAFFFNKQ
jgi:hypothetical protein